MGPKSENSSKMLPDPKSRGWDLSKNIVYDGGLKKIDFQYHFDASTRSMGENGPEIWKCSKNGPRPLI
jgi:hypothetical protein